jgi:TetR/AcrR family transcriptional regulator, regulator of cefoperazone and chloramphenicol sensitivity
MKQPVQVPATYKHPVHESDLTAAARIRNAALERFADAGLAATSIRDVAKAAGTSPGLVQHHFKTKAKLRDAVNEYVTSIVVDAFGDPAEEEPSADPIQAAGDRISAFVSANPTALRYLGRAVVEGDPAARRVFNTFVAVILSNLERLAESGSLHRDLDLEWAAMHLVIFNLATILFENAIDENLPEPLFGPQQLRRWNVATTELYRRGLFR